MYIRAVEYVLPQKCVDTKEVAAWTLKDYDFIRNKIGVSSRHYLSPGETTTTLASQACEKLFDKNEELSRLDVDFLILVTQNNDYKLPHGSAIIQGKLGLSNSCASLDINLGCSGYVYALSVAKGFAIANNFKNGVIITCDPYSKIMSRGDSNTVPLFGDAASATWMSSEKGAKIGQFDFGTDGTKYDSLIVRNGGTKRPVKSLFEYEDFDDDDEWRLEMNGRSIFNFMIREVPSSIKRTLEKNKVSISDVDLMLCHQASSYLLNTLSDVMSVPAEKMPISMSETGNTVSSSVPILLKKYVYTNRYPSGRKILLSGFGVGLSWATTIIETGENN
mgnify:FL=1|jgi:3-oxoacyl-[acyl-carrier-protein] synthase III